MGKYDVGVSARILLTGLFFALTFSLLASICSAQYYDDYTYYDSYCIVCNVITGIMSLMMAIWVYMDALALVGPNGKISKTTPLLWAIAVFLLWAICFPWYLYARRKYKSQHEKEWTQQNRPPCKFCGGPLTWLPNKQYWYCTKCKK